MLDPVKDIFTVAGLRALITKIVGRLSSKVAKTDVVSSWQSTPDDTHVPTEKLVRDTIDNLTPADVGAATAEQGAKADSAVQGVKVNGTELSKDSNNKVDVPVPTASTATPLKDGTASAGSSSQWARYDHVHPTDDSREAVSNKKQVVNDSSTTEYPSSKAVADFVNSSVATNTANFLGTISESSLGLDYTATNEQIALALNVHSWENTPTNNDYCFVSVNDPQTTDVDEYRRFKFNGSVWAYEYTLNNSSFTQPQWDAINSGLTSGDRTAYNAAVTLLNSHVGDGSIHVTTSEKNAWNGKQDAISDLATIRSGAAAGATALQPSGNGSNLSVTPDGTSTGTDIGNSTTLKAWAQKFKNLVTSLAGYVPTSRTVNGHALSSNVDVTAADVGLGNVVDTGDSATPESGGTKKFTTGGAYTELAKKADNTPTYSESSSRDNLAGSGETMPTILGKIKKWFSDLSALYILSFEGMGGPATHANALAAYNTLPNKSFALKYDTNGAEETIFMSAGTTRSSWGNMLKWGNYSNYIYISHKTSGQGVSPSTDWEKIKAGYADSAGTATDSTKLPLAGGTMTGDIVMQVSSGSARQMQFKMAGNDSARVCAGGSSNAGWFEIATAEDGNEPVYVRQYSGSFTTVVRTLTLLDGSGNTQIPAHLIVGGKTYANAGLAVKGNGFTVGTGDSSVSNYQLPTELYGTFYVKHSSGSNSYYMQFTAQNGQGLYVAAPLGVNGNVTLGSNLTHSHVVNGAMTINGNVTVNSGYLNATFLYGKLVGANRVGLTAAYNVNDSYTPTYQGELLYLYNNTTAAVSVKYKNRSGTAVSKTLAVDQMCCLMCIGGTGSASSGLWAFR